MERQVYPQRLNTDGTAEPPYDVAGWTLPLQMGVRAVTVAKPFVATADQVEQVEPIRGGIDGKVEDAKSFWIDIRSNEDFRVVNALQQAGIPIDLSGTPPQFRFPADPAARRVLERVLPTVSTRVHAASTLPDSRDKRLPPSRIGLYQPWVPSMDEGWTRLVLEKYGFAYTTVHNAEICGGGLKGRFDVLILPSIAAKTIREGYAENETEPAYVGGLGARGPMRLREFLRAGGTLVCLAESSDYAIEELILPVKNVLKGLKTSDFYSPGSILRAVVTEPSFWTTAVAPEVSVYFDRSQAFEIDGTARLAGQASVLLSYARRKPLESGWLLGPEKIEGKAAMVDVRSLGGHVILFGFRPQHRGQTHGTFRLLFNALL